MQRKQRLGRLRVRFTTTRHSEAITDARCGLMRNSSSTQQQHDRHTSLPWRPTEHVQPDRKQVCAVNAPVHSASRKTLGGGCCINCVLWAGTPQWSVFVCCVIEREWGMSEWRPLPPSLNRWWTDCAKTSALFSPSGWVWRGFFFTNYSKDTLWQKYVDASCPQNVADF